MEKVIRIFASHQEAEEAELDRYARMTPEERLRILFTLVNPNPNDPDTPRLERVAKFIKLRRG